MKNDNLANNKYKYNNIHFGENDNEYVLEISKIANDLYNSSSNRKNYNFLINYLNHEVMGDSISDEENDLIQDKPSYNEFKSNRVHNDNTIYNKHINTISTNYTTTKNISNTPSPRFDNKLKKYTDVHANTKYYYPDTYETNDDLDFSQWSDRSNRLKYYGRIKESNIDDISFKQNPRFDYKKY